MKVIKRFNEPGVALSTVAFGAVVRRAAGPDPYLVASPMDCSGRRILVTLGGGIVKHVAQDTRVIVLDAYVTVYDQGDEVLP